MYLLISRAKVKKHAEFKSATDVKADGLVALPFLVPTEDALNSGSSLNSFVFRRSINPLTAIPMRNEVRTLLNDQKDKNLMM